MPLVNGPCLLTWTGKLCLLPHCLRVVTFATVSNILPPVIMLSSITYSTPKKQDLQVLGENDCNLLQKNILNEGAISTTFFQ